MESSNSKILLFYYFFNKRCCHQVVKLKLNTSKIKPFDVKFGHIIHFKTAQVHLNATFGKYQILIYCIGILVKFGK